MPDKKNNNSKRVLVAPLDWGLGHATRCIPLIQGLLDEGNQVFLAGSGPSGYLLRSSFPELPYNEIPAHPVRYARTKRGFHWSILKQLPALLKQTSAEKKWINQFCINQPIDQVISDNRYGLHHPAAYNILLTHQLGLRSGLSPWADRILQYIKRRLLKNFQEVWIPDHADGSTLSGALGHPTYKTRVPIKYIGPLSRFRYRNHTIIPDKITIVLSGPEPQRSLLEEKCIKELADRKGAVTLIRALPQKGAPIHAPKHWKVFDHLPTDQMQKEIEEAALVIARCGYSTLMDLSTLKKPAILIPTPGQPEQEYLASWINNKHRFICINQDDLLSEAIKRLEDQSGSHDKFATE